LEGRYPLWGRDTAQLYEECLALGYRAVVVCVDTARLPAALCGQEVTAAFRAGLAAGAGPGGERGEYHPFTFAGPAFRRAVDFRLGAVHLQAPFAFQELHPGEPSAALA